MRHYRVIDTGEALTVGKVEFDPYGEPASVDLALPEAQSLEELAKELEEIIEALRLPVISNAWFT